MRKRSSDALASTTGSSSLISDQREPLPTSSDSPRSLKRCLVRPAFRFAEGDATRKRETPLAESSRRATGIDPVNETIG
jgi:hypothetical protein